MTISQSSSSQGSRLSPLASWGRSIARALACWRTRRRAAADLARLAEAGDYLLRDVGLDPKLARENPAALVDQVIRSRSRPIRAGRMP
jgi:uncharacterized protein YjiS (DUF1127 family)